MASSIFQKRSAERYFTNVDSFSTRFLVYGEAQFGEHNTMFSGYTYGKPSFGKQNFLQFLKEMDCETIAAAHECFKGVTPAKEQTPKASMKFVKEWHQKFNSNLHSSFIDPDFLEGRTSASQIHCKVTFPVTREERTYVFDVAKGADLTKGVLLYANTIALQLMAEEGGNEEKVACLDRFKYNGQSIVNYYYNEDSKDDDSVVIVRCEFELSPVGLW